MRWLVALSIKQRLSNAVANGGEYDATVNLGNLQGKDVVVVDAVAGEQLIVEQRHGL